MRRAASLAIRDQRVITASGLGALEFTLEILDELALLSPERRTLWYDAFKRGIYPEDVVESHRRSNG